jgi:hypothetical protein
MHGRRKLRPNSRDARSPTTTFAQMPHSASSTHDQCLSAPPVNGNRKLISWRPWVRVFVATPSVRRIGWKWDDLAVSVGLCSEDDYWKLMATGVGIGEACRRLGIGPGPREIGVGYDNAFRFVSSTCNVLQFNVRCGNCLTGEGAVPNLLSGA